MKKLLKIVAGIVIGIFLLLLLLPVVFKGKIEGLVKEEINNQLNAKVEYKQFSLSLIKGFPNISMGIEDLSVVGVDKFANDTLMAVNNFSTQVDIWSAISGEIAVKKVLISDLYINALVLPDSSANWDIVKVTEELPVEESVETDASSDFKIILESFIVQNANVSYTDNTMGLKSDINSFNLNLSGDLSEAKSNLDLSSSIDKLNLNFDNTDYIKNASLSFNAGIGADMENMIFSFLENELKLNQLLLKMDGAIQVKENAYGMDLKLGTSETNFKSLLGLIPEEFLKDFEGLETEGIMSLNANVKGDYIDENNIPTFNAQLLVDGGKIQYPDLPESINNIDVDLLISNTTGHPDSTLTDLSKFHFELANNPFDATLKLSRPVSNPTFLAKVDGKIDLESLTHAIPMDEMDVKGLIEADFAMGGDYAMIEKEDYESIDANGDIELSNFFFRSEQLPQGMTINNAKMTIDPRKVKLASFNCLIGQSDFKLSGILENYLAYALKDGVLKGQLNHNSKLINSNEFLAMTSAPAKEAETVEETVALVIVPKNIDFVMQSKVDKLIYDKLHINNASGKVLIKNGVINLPKLKMNLLDGSMTMAGQYNTANEQKPYVDFDIEGSKLDLNMAANSFSMVDSILPLAKKTIGKVSPKFKYYSLLDKDAMPVMSSMNGGGWLRSKSVEISGSKIQNNLASTLKNDSYKKMRAEDLNINFIIDKGNITIKPFKTNVGGKVVEVQGTQGLDQSVDYKITMPVSRKEVSKMAASMFGFSLPSSGNDIIVDVLVTGTVQDPKLGFDLEKAQKQIAKDLEKEGENLLKNFLKGF